MTADQIRDLGSFRVEIYRGQHVKRSAPKAVVVPNEEPITAIAEKTIKGRAISNIIKCIS